MRKNEQLNTYTRGDMLLIRNEKATGKEQNGTRPAVVVGNNIGNAKSPVLIICYLTSEDKPNLPTHAAVKGINDTPSTVLCEQPFTVDKSRVLRYIKTCTKKEMARVNRALSVSLAI